MATAISTPRNWPRRRARNPLDIHRRPKFGPLGGGIGMGHSQHSGIVIVCDGTEAADKRIARVLWNDPGTGVMRHADAGYEIAKACAKEQGLKLPMA